MIIVSEAAEQVDLAAQASAEECDKASKEIAKSRH